MSATVTERKPYDESLEDQEFAPVYENPTAGTVAGVLCDVVPYGWQTQPAMEKGGKDKQVFKVELRFQIDETKTQGNYAGERFIVRRRFNLSLSPKASMTPYYEALQGRPVTSDEMTGKAKIGVKTIIGLIGKSVLLQLAPSIDGKYINCVGVMGLPKGTAPLTIEGYVRERDR